MNKKGIQNNIICASEGSIYPSVSRISYLIFSCFFLSAPIHFLVSSLDIFFYMTDIVGIVVCSGRLLLVATMQKCLQGKLLFIFITCFATEKKWPCSNRTIKMWMLKNNDDKSAHQRSQLFDLINYLIGHYRTFHSIWKQ